MGVMGIIIPDVATAERARAAVAAAKFAPVGDRGLFSASRQSGYGIVGGAEYTRWTNRQVVLGIQIESREAIDKIDEILAVDGIDLVLSGRGDLSNALGVTGQKNHPSVLQAEEKIFSKAVARGLAISPQLDSFSPDISDEIRSWNEKGAYIISLGVDAALIRRAFADAVVRARG
jgi:4-hydroxy-2-oxoheptanedioate aldolase